MSVSVRMCGMRFCLFVTKHTPPPPCHTPPNPPTQLHTRTRTGDTNNEGQEQEWVREALVQCCLALDAKLAELPQFQVCIFLGGFFVFWWCC